MKCVDLKKKECATKSAKKSCLWWTVINTNINLEYDVCVCGSWINALCDDTIFCCCCCFNRKSLTEFGTIEMNVRNLTVLAFERSVWM